MWSKTYTKTVTGIKVEDIWHVWADVNQWHLWHDDLEYAKLNGEFKTGNMFIIKLKNGPKFNIQLIKVEQNRCFIDLTCFPLAKMYGIHEFITNGNTIEIKTTMKVEGILAFLWRKLAAEKIAAGEEEQTNKLIQRVNELNKN